MRHTYITAGVIAILIVLWLFSGQAGETTETNHPTLAEQNRIRAAEAQDAAPPRVRAQVINASPQVRQIVLRGKTENKRTVAVRAETTGRIIERPVERGTRVNGGDVLCRLATDDRTASLREAEETLNQARIDYDGNLKLRERGFQSESAIAQAAARVAAAEALVKRRQLDLEWTSIRAPFPAIVEDIHLEVGDYASTGTTCVTLVDMNPMLLRGRVAEREVHTLKLGGTAVGFLGDGREIIGNITFIGQQSDPATRTYAVEIEIPNPDLSLRSGLTARIQIPVAEVMAQKVSPALFALDDAGNIGVRTVDAQNRVEYHPISILRDDLDGVWVTGLPDVATVITVGQELVAPGQRVEVNYEPSPGMPAAAPQRTPDEQTAPGGRTRSKELTEQPAARNDAAVTARPAQLSLLPSAS